MILKINKERYEFESLREVFFYVSLFFPPFNRFCKVSVKLEHFFPAFHLPTAKGHVVRLVSNVYVYEQGGNAVGLNNYEQNAMKIHLNKYID